MICQCKKNSVLNFFLLWLKTNIREIKNTNRHLPEGKTAKAGLCL